MLGIDNEVSSSKLFAWRNCLTSPKTHSIGFRSGEYGGKNLTKAPTPQMAFTACSISVVNGSIVHNNYGIVINSIKWH